MSQRTHEVLDLLLLADQARAESFAYFFALKHPSREISPCTEALIESTDIKRSTISSKRTYLGTCMFEAGTNYLEVTK